MYEMLEGDYDNLYFLNIAIAVASFQGIGI